MIAEYGEISAVESKIAAYNKKLEALNKAAENQISIQSDHQFALRGVIAFNEQCAKNGKPKLDAVGISHYAKKSFLQHAFSIMLDSTYSRARGLIEMLGGEKSSLGIHVISQQQRRS